MRDKSQDLFQDVPAQPPEQHTRMSVPKDAPPGIELDGQGNPIPLDQRTPEDQARAAKVQKITE